MFPRGLRWVPVAVVLGFIAGGLLLMALYRPLPLGIGVFVLSSALLYPATRSARRNRLKSHPPTVEQQSREQGFETVA